MDRNGGYGARAGSKGFKGLRAGREERGGVDWSDEGVHDGRRGKDARGRLRRREVGVGREWEKGVESAQEYGARREGSRLEGAGDGGRGGTV